jgi:hypothetical protein
VKGLSPFLRDTLAVKSRASSRNRQRSQGQSGSDEAVPDWPFSFPVIFFKDLGEGSHAEIFDPRFLSQPSGVCGKTYGTKRQNFLAKGTISMSLARSSP